MNCCGNKRRQWVNDIKRPLSPNVSNEKISLTFNEEKPDRIVEYTGQSSIVIIGVFTGRQYNFRFKGDRKSVNYKDSLALMAENDLKISTVDKVGL